MDFTVIRDMYQKLWAFIYDILAIFGITVDENGNLVK